MNLDEHWLFDYAKAACGRFSNEGIKLKGRGHSARVEVDEYDPFEKCLPHVWLSKPIPGSYRPLEGKKHGGFKYGRVRVAAAEHYDKLSDELLSCGYDLANSRVICPVSYTVAQVHWRIFKEVMPEEMRNKLLGSARAKLIAKSRHEDRDLFQSLKS